MNTIHTPNLPVPAGATAVEEWYAPTEFPEDFTRSLTWFERRLGKVGVSIEGAQFGDGHVDRYISVWQAENKELTPSEARELAAAVLEAADELERLENATVLGL